MIILPVPLRPESAIVRVMATLLGAFLDPFGSDPDEPEDWLVLRLVVRALGALWLLAVLGVAVAHRFVQLALDDDAGATR